MKDTVSITLTKQEYYLLKQIVCDYLRSVDDLKDDRLLGIIKTIILN